MLSPTFLFVMYVNILLLSHYILFIHFSSRSCSAPEGKQWDAHFIKRYFLLNAMDQIKIYKYAPNHDNLRNICLISISTPHPHNVMFHLFMEETWLVLTCMYIWGQLNLTAKILEWLQNQKNNQNHCSLSKSYHDLIMDEYTPIPCEYYKTIWLV